MLSKATLFAWYLSARQFKVLYRRHKKALRQDLKNGSYKKVSIANTCLLTLKKLQPQLYKKVQLRLMGMLLLLQVQYFPETENGRARNYFF